MAREWKYENPGEGYETPEQEYIESPIPISIVELSRKWKASECTVTDKCREGEWVNRRKLFRSSLNQPLPQSTAVQHHILTLEQLQRDILTYMGTKKQTFDDPAYEKAVRLLLEAMKLERLSRGLLSGEKPTDVEAEKQYDIQQLLDELAGTKK